MPLPDLKPGESESRADFITRCMRNNKINQESPDPEVRAGYCYGRYRKAKGIKKKGD